MLDRSTPKREDNMTEERIRGFSLQNDLTVEIADITQTWFKCQLCGVVDEQLISAPCQDTFCEKCVDENSILRCPVHGTCYNPLELSLDPSLKASLRQLEVHCLQKENGCSRIFKLQHLERHLATCGFVQVNCPCECGQRICRKKLAHHLTDLCDNRLISCQYCEDEIFCKDEKGHLESCPKKPVPCQFCKSVFINDEIATHSQECPMRPMPCSLAETIGCNFKGNSQELEKHQKDVESHLTLAIWKISQFEDTKRVVASLAEDIASVIKLCQDTRNEVASFVRELGNIRSQIQETKDEVASLITDITSVKNEIQSLPEVRKTILHLEREINSFNEEREKLKHIQLVKSEDRCSPMATINNTKSPNEEHKSNNSYKRGNYRVSSPPTTL